MTKVAKFMQERRKNFFNAPVLRGSWLYYATRRGRLQKIITMPSKTCAASANNLNWRDYWRSPPQHLKGGNWIILSITGRCVLGIGRYYIQDKWGERGTMRSADTGWENIVFFQVFHSIRNWHFQFWFKQFPAGWLFCKKNLITTLYKVRIKQEGGGGGE